MKQQKQQSNQNKSIKNHKPFMKLMTTEIAKFFTTMAEFCINQLTRYIVPNNQLKIQQKDRKCQTIIENKINKDLNDFKNQNIGEMIQLSLSSSSDKEYQQPKRKAKPKLKPEFTFHKPKAPTSSYLIFLHEKKAQFAMKFNLTSISQIAKLASEQWKKLSPIDKQKYNKQSEVQKCRYHQAMKQYKQDYSQQIKEYKRTKQIFYKKNWQLNKQRKQKDKLKLQKKKILQILSKKDKNKVDQQQLQVSSSNSYKQPSLNIKSNKKKKEKLQQKKEEENKKDLIDFSSELLTI